MKQKLKRFMAGFMAMLTLVGTLFTNGTTAFAASPQANIAFWNASVKNSGEVSELKPGYNHGKILYSILDGNSAYCMNFGLRADGGQLMNSYDDASTSMSAQQRKLLSYCKYFLSCVFEAVTMALAIVICNAFINAGLPAFTGSYADWAQTLIYLCEMTFTIAMTVGSVKGAQTLTSKAFGL